MRLLIQRVKEASVKVEEHIVGSIGKGALVFIGIHKDDTEDKALFLANKLLTLRFFPDQERKMHFNLHEVEGNILVVSQFTLYGNCLEGRRPDFVEAAPPDKAKKLYEFFVQQLGKVSGKKIETGSFGAIMEVTLINDGPVTFFIDK